MPSCAICRFEAPSDKHLRMHIATKHDDRVLTCENCGNTCKGGTKLKTHMESHREITCNNCEKKIPYNSRSSHMTKCVSDKKEFKCENCPAVFNTAGNLKAHITNKSCEIQCNLCDKTLTSAGYLDKHIASVHKVQMEVVKTTEGHIGLFQSTELQKDLHCNLCDFKATCAAKLKRHMIKPAKVKEKCPKCDLTFMFRSDLNRHVLTPHRDYVKGNSRSNQYRKIHNVISSCDSSTYRLRGCIITLVAFI